METILGIDLGTTNSEVSIIRDKEIIVVEKDGRKLLPSVVGIDPAGNLLVGHAARNQAILYPERTIKSIKRRMGDDTKIKLGDNEYTPPEISAMILKTLKKNAEEFLSQKFSKAVITVPAFFNDKQREATRLAGELAGLEVVRIINEPTAASLCYETEPEKTETENAAETVANKAETILVYDLGGGTFDVSIVRSEAGVIEVLASHGDTHLGGDDFDQLLFDYVCDKFKETAKFDLRKFPTAVSRLIQATEAAKIQLSSNPFARIKEEFIAEKDGAPLHLDIEIKRNDYERLIFPLLDKTITCLNEALEDAGLRPSNIDKIVMVGGSSRTPLVLSLVENRMGMTPHGEIDPDLCVTMGAAIQGGLIAGTEVGRILVDITPHTLGINTVNDYDLYFFSPLIKRNTPIPCKKSNVYYTVHKNQETVEISIYQGEHNDVRQNTLIGKFLLEGLAKGDEGQEIICQFNLDINGILHVTAIEKNTGLESSTVVENALTQRKPDANNNFKKQIKQLFHENENEQEYEDGHLGTLKSDADPTIENNVKNEKISIEGLDGDLSAEVNNLPKELNEMFANEIIILQKGLKMLDGNLKTNIKDVEELIKKIIIAIKQKNKNSTKELTTELDDMLYYLDDSI